MAMGVAELKQELSDDVVRPCQQSSLMCSLAAAPAATCAGLMLPCPSGAQRCEQSAAPCLLTGQARSSLMSPRVQSAGHRL